MTPANIKVRGLLIPIFIIGLTIASRADVVIDWNVIATDAAFAAGKNALEQSRIYAMTHAAIHDALNAIDRRYKSYALDRRAEPNASPEAAVAAAAHDVLVAQLPTQRATLDAAYAASLADIADGPAKAGGVAIGQAAAAAILALRSADGSTAPMPYTPRNEPGAYQLTPPNFAPAVLPGWGAVTPFALKSGAQFRPAPPKFFDRTAVARQCADRARRDRNVNNSRPVRDSAGRRSEPAGRRRLRWRSHAASADAGLSGRARPGRCRHGVSGPVAGRLRAGGFLRRARRRQRHSGAHRQSR